jgi:flagellar hook-associated protein 3 FlgL
MRIADSQVAALREYQINAAYEQLVQAQTVISTGRQINAPSDNPYGTSVALELQAEEAQNTGFSNTATDTLSWMQATDTALSGVGNVLTQARTLAVQASNGTLTSDNLQSIASQLSQLIQQAIQSANSTYGGRYVLGGYQDHTAPFALSADGSQVVYSGDTGAIDREISPGQTMQININGSGSAASPGTLPTTNGALPTAFAALLQLQSDLQSGNQTAIGTTDLTAIDQASDGILLAQGTNGASISRIQALQTTLSTTQTNLQAQYSTIVDADVAQASINYNSCQVTYQAALTIAGKSVEPSLLSFLQ